ncbi:hypothetical protein L9F63_008863, partial [Diploptera punctata]
KPVFLRVDFLEATLAPLVAGACVEDSVTILQRSQPQLSGYNIPFCGLLAGVSSCGIPNQELLVRPAALRHYQDPMFIRRRNVMGESRILGGQPVQNAYPWITLLLVDQSPQCGGSLVTEEWVLTAGHCLSVQDIPVAIPIIKRFMIVLGAVDIYNTMEKGRITRSVANVVRHPQYIEASNDIALLRLGQPVSISKLIRPVCLPTKPDETYAGQQGIIAGWGLTSNNVTTLPPFLMAAYVTILNNSFCSQLWSRMSIVIDDSHAMCRPWQSCHLSCKYMHLT